MAGDGGNALALGSSPVARWAGHTRVVKSLARGGFQTECDSESPGSFTDMGTFGSHLPQPGLSRSTRGRAQHLHSSSADSKAQPG